MEPGELSIAVDWAAAEGWNPGLHDAEAFWAADPEGFLIGLLSGQPAATISAVRYEGGFAFVGFYIVRPDLRGQGLGLAIWKQAMSRLRGRVVGLDGVPAQQDNYARSGFKLAYANRRYQGLGQGPAPDGLVPVAQVPFQALAAYDRPCFGYGREAFLGKWLALPGGAGLASLQGERIVGYGMIRPCRQGYKIGPLFADDPGQAQRLFRGLAAQAKGQPIFLDVPEINQQAVDLARAADMEPVFDTARMYLGGDPGLPVERIYGVTTFELG